MKKIFITFCFLFLTNPAFAQEIQDPDVKLSIAELKKKYPAKIVENIDERMDADYSIKEIKSAFLNADKNYIGPSKLKGGVEVHNQAQIYIIHTTCENYSEKPRSAYQFVAQNKKAQKLKSFIFSQKLIEHASPFLPNSTQECLKKNLIN